MPWNRIRKTNSPLGGRRTKFPATKPMANKNNTKMIATSKGVCLAPPTGCQIGPTHTFREANIKY